MGKRLRVTNVSATNTMTSADRLLAVAIHLPLQRGYDLAEIKKRHYCTFGTTEVEERSKEIFPPKLPLGGYLGC